MESKKFSFDGWNITEFIRGRKKLLVAAIGYIVPYLITSKPALSVIIAAGAELAYALIEYFCKKEDY